MTHSRHRYPPVHIRELKTRRRNETTTTTTGSWICTDARAAHVSVCVFVVHGSSTTKFARESGSRENVSNTFFLEALFRRFQLIFRVFFLCAWKSLICRIDRFYVEWIVLF